MKLHEKIYNVMCDSEALKKDTNVGTGKSSYKAIGEAAVLNAIKPLLKKYKLIILPIDVEITEHFTEYKTSNTYNGVTTVNDKARFMTQLKTKWKIIDVETGDFEILSAPGNGADTQDKASGKAWTYAYKAVLQKSFMLFSGEDTDNTHSNDMDKANGYSKPKIETNELIKLAYKKGISSKKVESTLVADHGHGMEFMTQEEHDELISRLTLLADK